MQDSQNYLLELENHNLKRQVNIGASASHSTLHPLSLHILTHFKLKIAESKHIQDRQVLDQKILHLSEQIASMRRRSMTQKENYNKLQSVLEDIEFLNMKRQSVVNFTFFTKIHKKAFNIYSSAIFALFEVLTYNQASNMMESTGYRSVPKRSKNSHHGLNSQIFGKKTSKLFKSKPSGLSSHSSNLMLDSIQKNKAELKNLEKLQQDILEDNRDLGETLISLNSQQKNKLLSQIQCNMKMLESQSIENDQNLHLKNFKKKPKFSSPFKYPSNSNQARGTSLKMDSLAEFDMMQARDNISILKTMKTKSKRGPISKFEANGKEYKLINIQELPLDHLRPENNFMIDQSSTQKEEDALNNYHHQRSVENFEAKFNNFMKKKQSAGNLKKQDHYTEKENSTPIGMKRVNPLHKLSFKKALMENSNHLNTLNSLNAELESSSQLLRYSNSGGDHHLKKSHLLNGNIRESSELKNFNSQEKLKKLIETTPQGVKIRPNCHTFGKMMKNASEHSDSRSYTPTLNVKRGLKSFRTMSRDTERRAIDARLLKNQLMSVSNHIRPANNFQSALSKKQLGSQHNLEEDSLNSQEKNSRGLSINIEFAHSGQNKSGFPPSTGLQSVFRTQGKMSKCRSLSRIGSGSCQNESTAQQFDSNMDDLSNFGQSRMTKSSIAKTKNSTKMATQKGHKNYQRQSHQANKMFFANVDHYQDENENRSQYTEKTRKMFPNSFKPSSKGMKKQTVFDLSISQINKSQNGVTTNRSRFQRGKFKHSSMDCDVNLLTAGNVNNTRGKLSISKMKIDFKTGKIGLKFGPPNSFSKKRQMFKSKRKSNLKLASQSRKSHKINREQVYNIENPHRKAQRVFDSLPFNDEYKKYPPCDEFGEQNKQYFSSMKAYESDYNDQNCLNCNPAGPRSYHASIKHSSFRLPARCFRNSSRQKINANIMNRKKRRGNHIPSSPNVLKSHQSQYSARKSSAMKHLHNQILSPKSRARKSDLINGSNFILDTLDKNQQKYLLKENVRRNTIADNSYFGQSGNSINQSTLLKKTKFKKLNRSSASSMRRKSIVYSGHKVSRKKSSKNPQNMARFKMFGSFMNRTCDEQYL